MAEAQVVVAVGVFGLAVLTCSPRRLSVALLFLGLVSLTWLEFRSFAGATLSDGFLVGAAISTFVTRTRLGGGPPIDLSPHRYILTYSALLIVGGVVGGLVYGGTMPGFLEAAQFAVAITLITYLVAAHVTDVSSWERLVAWLVAGAAVSAVVAHWPSNRTGFVGRATGLGTHPNHLALAMMLAAGFAAALLGSERRPHRVLAWLALPIVVSALIWSGSRAGLAGFIVGSVVLAMLSRAKGVLVLGMTLLATPLVLAVLWSGGFASSSSAVNRLLRPSVTEDVSNEGRWEYLREGLDLIEQRPFFGAGFDQALRFHSVPFQLVVVAGVAGLLALAALIAFGMQSVALARRSSSPWRVRVMASSLVGLGAFWVVANALFDRYLLVSISLTAACFGLERRSSSTSLRGSDQDDWKAAARGATLTVGHRSGGRRVNQ